MIKEYDFAYYFFNPNDVVKVAYYSFSETQ